MRDRSTQFSTCLLLVMNLMVAGCSDPYPKEYSAAPLSARIVDSETGEPVEGAIVVAVYVMESLSGRVYTPIHYEETLTDESGNFTFNGFDKKSAPRELTGDAAVFGMRDPRLYAFAEGYLPAMYQRAPIFSKLWKESHRVSPLNGKELTMSSNQKITLRIQSEYLFSMISSISTDINSRVNPGTGKKIPCAFNLIPVTLRFIQNQLENFEQSGESYMKFHIQQETTCFKEGKGNEN